MLEKIDGNMPIYANLQKNRNGLKAGKYEVFEYDQGAIRLPRQSTAKMPISQIKRALMILKKPFYSKFTQSEMTNGICHKPAKTLVNMPLCGVIIPPLIEKGGIF